MGKKVDTKPLVDYDGVFTKEERRRILSRIDSMFSWAGASIPESVELDGEYIPIRKTINDLIMKDELDDNDRGRISKLVRALSKKERDLKELIKKGDISEEKGVELYDEIRGILRAVAKLRRLSHGEDDDDSDVERAALMRKVDDERRWKEFLKKVR